MARAPKAHPGNDDGVVTADPPAPEEAATAEAAPRPRRVARKRAGTLVVVESPAKGKTIKRFLGEGFTVLASGGHVKDLPEARLGVDVSNGFLPEYEALKGKSKVLSDLKRAARTAERVLLATDPDREGEAIAWHIAEELGGGAADRDERVRRVLFHEITEGGIREAIAAPQPLDRNRFDAQQARRILDRLVGFQVSPILWKKVRRGLSAGRVQSVAVRLVVEREREIDAFEPIERGTLRVELAAGEAPAFRASLAGVDGAPAALSDAAEAEALAAELAGARWRVTSVEREEVRREPPPPFTTAKLQQEAARRLGLSPKRTMALAQRLYEGVELEDEGAVGLVTYPRTDSVRLSAQAVDAVRAHVAATFGEDHLPGGPIQHAGNPRAQAGHEAIRPTSLAWTPARLAAALEGERDLVRLYRLVWNRFVACQMAPAIHDRTAVEIEAGRATFHAEGVVLRSPGFLAAEPVPDVPAGSDEADGEEGAAAGALPGLEPGAALSLVALDPSRHLSAPPPRFDEAGLVQELDERGIGRPSTFAAILETIQEREYVERVEKRLRPTALGTLVVEELGRAFPRELDFGFTADLEGHLDAVEAGTAPWQTVLADFYGPFQQALARAEASIREVKRPEVQAELACEKCGKPMAVRWGRNGEFLSCTGYPTCRSTLNFRREDGKIVVERDEEVTVDEICPVCGSPMAMKRGRFGRFLACTRYPKCKGAKPVSIGVDCPKGCGGFISERRSRHGKTFYGCSSYPKCDFVSWDRPRNEPCPRCGSAYTVQKLSPRAIFACPHKECGWRGEPGANNGGDPDPGASPGP
jgi:DNA topoisomerase I